MLSFHKLIFAKSSNLTLEQVIFKEILIILSVVAFFAGIQNLIIDYPLWVPLVFFAASCISFAMFIYTQITEHYRKVKIAFIIILYFIIIINWFTNSGLNGGIVLFILVATIYTIGIYNNYYYRLFILNFLIFISLVLITLWFPQTLSYEYKNETEHVLDMIFTYFLGSLSVVLILRNILNNYNNANKLVEVQKKELETSHKKQLEANQLLGLKNKDLETINQVINEQAKELKHVLYTKDKLLSIIAHDLKNPISGIMGISQLLEKRLIKSSDEKNKIFIEQIVNASLSTLTLLSNLLDWANFQAGQINIKPLDVSLQNIINEVIGLLSPSAKLKNISLNYLYTDDIQIHTDRYFLHTIIRNLVSNSIKFTNHGGEVNIKLISDRTQIEITVTDTGVGMSPKQIKNLFELTNKKSTLGTANEKGSGLGLVLCKEFAEKLGGKIHLKSKEGKGSEFKVVLPLKSQA